MDNVFLNKILPVSVKMMTVVIFFSGFLLLVTNAKKISIPGGINLVIVIVAIFSVILSYNIVKKIINNIKNMFC